VASEHGQRKIAAILVSDVVGYSRLAGADEDRALARLSGDSRGGVWHRMGVNLSSRRAS
jgi:class 3 adenylate cyclase